MKQIAHTIYLLITLLSTQIMAQQKVLTPEILWELGRLSPIGVSEDQSQFFYKVTTPNLSENDFSTTYYAMPAKGGEAHEVSKDFIDQYNQKKSPSGKYVLIEKEVKVKDVYAKDFYKDLPKSSGKLYNDLQHRHWDSWLDGKFNHAIIQNTLTGEETELLEGKPYIITEVLWHPTKDQIIYVTKEQFGKEYMTSTNSDIFLYDVEKKTTRNLTEGMLGYDTQAAYNKEGVLAWTSMAEDGYEADKNDLYILKDDKKINLTKDWDNTVMDIFWSKDGQSIYFIAPTPGEQQLFRIQPFVKAPKVEQLTKGMHNITGIVADLGKDLIVTKTDMNHAEEAFLFNLNRKDLTALTHVNDAMYAELKPSKVEQRWVETTDHKQMLVNVIYPPNFDASKKYPTLLYLQGGPQSPVNQFYSFRWNFALMAAEGYIVVAPNRRGLPGFGDAWNREISGDWGGQSMRDYLSAIDALKKEPYVDNERIGAVGASYGGYSVYYLAGIHDGRFKSFIAHCGVFDLKSMYGTTEELFFVNKDLGGPYWEEKNHSFKNFDPISNVQKWDTPILIIHNEQDYRVPMNQGLEAFTAAKLLGLKTELLTFPDENHWVLQPQNGIFWQRTFFKWLADTL